MFIMPSFKKTLIVEQFQGNYLNCPKMSGFTPVLAIRNVLDSFHLLISILRNSQLESGLPFV